MGEDKLLRLADVRGLVRLSKAQIYRLARAGRFPRPLHVGTSAVWRASAVQAWIASLGTDAPAGGDAA